MERLLKTVEEIDRMLTNEKVDKPRVDKVISIINKEKSEILPMENTQICGKMLENIEKKADVNKDGSVSFFEMINFFISNPVYIFLALALISLNPIKDFLITGIEDNMWNWSNLLSSILTAFTGIIFYYVTKSMDSNTQKIINTMKEQYESKIIAKDNELCVIKSDLENVKMQLQALNLSNELKKQEIELISKKLV